MTEEKRTELGSLGEFGLIRRLTDNLGQRVDSTVLGVGDDAAIIDPPSGKQMVVSTDMLVEGIHFDLSFAPLKHLGYKCVAVNLSDIAAMNAIPSQITVNIAVSNRFSVEALEELYEGMKLACELYKVDLVGGDTTSSTSGLVVSITAIGFADKEIITRRSGAKPGDIICVTGDLGGAFIGLQLLEREKQVYLADPEMQPKLEGRDYIVARQLRPNARMDFVHSLHEIGVVPTSMMDISDGLASELLHISNSSKVGVRVYEEHLPIDKETEEVCLEFNINPTTAMMNGGEDYELLLTLPEDIYKDKKMKNHPDLTSIGVVTDDPNEQGLVLRNGNQHKIEAQGWNHFRPE